MVKNRQKWTETSEKEDERKKKRRKKNRYTGGSAVHRSHCSAVEFEMIQNSSEYQRRLEFSRERKKTVSIYKYEADLRHSVNPVFSIVVHRFFFLNFLILHGSLFFLFHRDENTFCFPHWFRIHLDSFQFSVRSSKDDIDVTCSR